jgi:hypothetical protein
VKFRGKLCSIAGISGFHAPVHCVKICIRSSVGMQKESDQMLEELTVGMDSSLDTFHSTR